MAVPLLKRKEEDHTTVTYITAAMESQSTERTFETALEALYSPLHQSQTPQAIQAAAARRTCTVADMRLYFQRIGLDTDVAFQKKRLVHITGTKGKGSTSCLCESILRNAYKQRTAQFTSPHLIDIRERIRIDGRPVSQSVFGQAYWDLRTRLQAAGSEEEDLPVLPGYFRMLTLMVSILCGSVGWVQYFCHSRLYCSIGTALCP
jgi:folylpolyglutamate synthase